LPGRSISIELTPAWPSCFFNYFFSRKSSCNKAA
jgi:hypothetical protein